MKKIRFGVVGTNNITDWVIAGGRQDERFALKTGMLNGQEFFKRLTRFLTENRNLKIIQKNFGSLKLMRTFAVPFEKRASKEGLRSSLKRLFYCTRSKYREIQFIEKR